ncbi:MAG TPA: ABC transporter ATP-binding protein [Phycisphaerales bacterium]|nr:ABC transporter ATP-binding protein [Phycisphaerales bacterium]
MGQILRAEKICKSYDMGENKVEVLKGLDLSVAEGEFLAIIGASGSGKSTLLHILGALDTSDSGTVEFRGERIDQFRCGKLNNFRNKKVGFVFQFYHLLDELNILENVTLPAMAAGSTLSWLKQRITAKKRGKELLDRLGLGQRIKHKPYQLSGGERQRVAIARAVMNGPALLLADEPTGNLDSETGNGILDVFKEFNNDGQTIIMVTHDEHIADRVDRVIKLIDGRMSN